MSERVKFTKMHGLGNDFVVLDGITQKISIEKIPIRSLSDRHAGIGFDQLIFLEKSNRADFSCRFFNSDGSEAEQCGNGVRCAARLAIEKKIVAKKSLSIETKAKIVQVKVPDFEQIEVNMGVPVVSTKAGPQSKNFSAETLFSKLSLVSIGNPHAIIQVDSLINFPLQETGEKISKHSAFPDGVNAGFMEVIDDQTIKLITYERGVGITLACGSNACAAVAAGFQNKILKEKVKVILPLGYLWVEWEGEGKPIFLTGPAARVFEGEIITAADAHTREV